MIFLALLSPVNLLKSVLFNLTYSLSCSFYHSAKDYFIFGFNTNNLRRDLKKSFMELVLSWRIDKTTFFLLNPTYKTKSRYKK